MAKFCQLNFQIENRKLYDPVGRPVDYPLKVGGVIIHWADPARAAGWFKHADNVALDMARVAALDAPINKSDIAANKKQAADQFGFILEILTSLAHGYNLLNTVWWNDPEARSLYRVYVAGLPAVENQGSGDNYVRALFSEAFDYNPAWYTKDFTFPHVTKRPDKWGVLQNRAVDVTARKGGKNGDNFIISASMTMAPTGGLKQGETIEAAEAIYNIPVVRAAYEQQCGPGAITLTPMAGDWNATNSGTVVGNSADNLVFYNTAADNLGYPWKQQCDRKSLYGIFQNPGFGFHSEGYYALLPDGSELSPGFDDWRAAYLIELSTTGVDTGPGSGRYISAPLREYLTYLRAWTARMTSRTPQQIIQDTRAFVIYQNSMTIERNGSSVQDAWAKIVGTAASIESQKHAKSAEASIVSGVLTAAAGVAATIPGAGSVVALVLGAAAVVVSVGDALITKGTRGHGRNDLGQYKLQFERAWLSNDPTALSEDQGSPLLPQTEFLDPPGSWPDVPCNTLSKTPSGTSGTGGGSTPSGIQAIFEEKNLKWIFGGIAAVTLVGILASSRR